MYKIGLTGGIGSGKTRVANLLADWGADLVDTDVIAHTLTAPGGEAMPLLVEAFGPQAMTSEGALDRTWMRELVFRERDARAQLEGILHPLIGIHVERAAAQAQGAYLVYVVPLLVESGRWRDRVDRICVVDCDPDTQIARVQHRSGLTIESIRRIMAAQAARSVRLAAADDVVLNDGQTTADMLFARTKDLHDRWCQMATASRRPLIDVAGSPD